MLEAILAFFKEAGLWGLYGTIFLEGSSIPYPGVAIVLLYGGILKMSLVNTAFTAGAMAVVYTLASLIPYHIGEKVLHLLSPKFHRKMAGATRFFTKHGIWSIALSRPFGIGNYISYLAGMSGVGKGKYLALTFLGIFPWCFAMLFLGDFFNGNYAAFRQFYHEYNWIVYILMGLGIAGFVLYSFRGSRREWHNPM